MGLGKVCALCVLAAGMLVHGKTALPLVNGGFEDGTTGWLVTDKGKTHFMAEAAYSGKMGVRVIDTDVQSGSEMNSERLPGKAGYGYEVSFMIRSEENSDAVGFYLQCYDAQGICLSTNRKMGEFINFFEVGKEWTRCSFTAVAPVGTTEVGIRVHSIVAKKGVVDIDDFEIYELTLEETAEALKSGKARLSTVERRRKEMEEKKIKLSYEEFEKAIQVVEVSIHPRLFASAQKFEALRHAVENVDGVHKRMYDRLVFLANGLLGAKPVTYKVTGKRLLDVSRMALYRISTLALCYRLNGREDYRDRCIAEMRAIAAFPEWHPSHFLDVGEMTLALATGYDWLYDELTDEDRASMAKAILELGLKSADKNAWWRLASNNWGQVCHAGMIAGALAVAEVDPATCRKQLYESIRAMGIPMREYAPNGNYPEGPGYWEYGTGFNVLALSMLFQAFGTDFGLSELEGFKETGYFLDYIIGPSGFSFNFADGGMGRRSSMGSTWWFANHFEAPEMVVRAERKTLELRCADRRPVRPERNSGWFNAYAFFWIFDEESDEKVREMPLVWNGGGKVPIVVMRNSWDDKEAVFIALKGGRANAPHGHMDGGSFVYDAKGVRWFHDLGMEPYHRLEQMGYDLWPMHQGSGRWKLFRLGNRGHNTLVIDGKLHVVSGEVEVVSVTDGPVKTTVLDMTKAYANACSSAIRTVTMREDGLVEIVDELKGVRSGAPVMWGVTTKQRPGEPNGDIVGLSSKEHKIQLEKIGSKGAWVVTDVEVPEPKMEANSRNKNTWRIEYTETAPEDGNVTLRTLIRVIE